MRFIASLDLRITLGVVLTDDFDDQICAKPEAILAPRVEEHPQGRKANLCGRFLLPA
jgi:hypothetical protein